VQRQGAEAGGRVVASEAGGLGGSRLLELLSSGDADAAALFTKDSLVFTGAGTLTVTGNNSEGIAGDDDIFINNGTITVTAVGDGLAANDDITINGGDVTVTARGDGLDSNGTVHVNGGTLVAFGGIAQGEGGVDVRGLFVITGGTVIAGGNAIAALSSDSRQTSVYVTSSAIQPAGTTVRLERDEHEVFVFTPDTAYQNVLISSDDLTGGAIYQAYLGEKAGNVVIASR
jgi:Carbohydrate-binding domain-containing protein Cthe_2159